jgi:hypothetical protein
MKIVLRRSFLAGIALSVLVSSAQATLVWNGSASGGISIFKNTNIQTISGTYVGNPSANGSYIRAINDSTYGSIWEFFKASGDRRCEVKGGRGWDPTNGNTFYMGWAFNLNNLVNNNCIFQWHGYGPGMTQDHPIVLKMIDGNLALEHYAPGEVRTRLWARRIAANTWYKVYMRVRVSDSNTGGSISFWFEGAQQTLLNGSTSFTGRTLDGTSSEPKWGVYGADNSNVRIRIRRLRAGTALADVQF